MLYIAFWNRTYHCIGTITASIKEEYELREILNSRCFPCAMSYTSPYIAMDELLVLLKAQAEPMYVDGQGFHIEKKG